MDASTVLGNVREVAARFAAERPTRQRRRELVAADFDQLSQAGFLLCGVPMDQGGCWENVSRSARPVSEILRTLAQADPSVALVASMHPAVLAMWLATPEVEAPWQPAWEAQRRQLFETARAGAWWGTITSEPGSGGDITKTRSVAQRAGADTTYRLSGDKHFGSGSGITSYMMTTAVADGEPAPDLFFLDVRGAAWDGSSGLKLTAPWGLAYDTLYAASWPAT